jgi:hypothetical protein
MHKDLTDFLLARIAEDEDDAREAAVEGRYWAHFGGGQIAHGTDDRQAWGDLAHVRVYIAPHIVRWDPARVLAECEAKRRIVEQHLDNESRAIAYRSPRWADAMNDEDRVEQRKAEARLGATDGVLRALALPYADHPDYDVAWVA